MPRLHAFLIAFAAAAFAQIASASSHPEDAGREWARAVWLESASGDLDAACSAYEDFARKHPDHPKAAAALLRKALCLEKAGDPALARAAAAEVSARHPRSAAARAGAEELLRRLDEASTRSARERENQSLLRENEALKLRLSALTELLERARSQAGASGRDEEAWKREIESLRSRIAELAQEGEKFREKIKTFEAGRIASAPLTPEEILDRLEQEALVRDQESRTLSDHFYRTGMKLQAEERYQEALENYRQCLKLWDGHTGARERIMAVGTILGDKAGAERDLIAQLEIRKEVRTQESKAELANALRRAFEAYRMSAFEEAGRLFTSALDILVTSLAQDPEFDRQKDLAARYIRLCQKGIKQGEGKVALVSVRVVAIASSADLISKAAAAAGAVFEARGERGNACAVARLAAPRAAEFMVLLGGPAERLMDEIVSLAPGEPAHMSRSAPDGDGKSGAFVVNLSAEPAQGGIEIEITVETVFPPSRLLGLPGQTGSFFVGDPSRRVAQARVSVATGVAAVVAGIRNPFDPARLDEIVLLVEVQ